MTLPDQSFPESSSKRHFGAFYFAGVLLVLLLIATQRDDVGFTGVTEIDQCVEECLVIYLAPWCPVCGQLLPTITDLSSDLRAEGIPVVFIVGDDTSERCEAYAEGLLGSTALDPDASLAKQMGVKGFPTFLLVASEGKITNRLSGGIDDKSALREALGL